MNEKHATKCQTRYLAHDGEPADILLLDKDQVIAVVLRPPGVCPWCHAEQMLNENPKATRVARLLMER
jgi:hypothetical protein